MKRYKIITLVIILFLLACFCFYIEGFFGILTLFVQIGVYIIFFYLISIILRKLRKKEIANFYIFVQNFLFSISVFFIVITILFGGTVYYFNEINPASMKFYTISNGEKIVKFQTMIHIGKKNFYEKVKRNLEDFKKEGAVYFYEGVKLGSEESSEKFNKALGIKFDKDLYKNFSKLYGVDFQDNSIFLGIVNDKDFNIDLDMDEIVKIYEEKNINGDNSEKLPLDANGEILKTLSTLNDRELKIINYLNQAILNIIIGNDEISKSLENFQNKELFSVILNERNKIVAEAIINSKDKKIFITYGKLHFEGIFKLLQQDDKNWKIIKQEDLYPIK